jgi:hypothetical protein
MAALCEDRAALLVARPAPTATGYMFIEYDIVYMSDTAEKRSIRCRFLEDGPTSTFG